MQKQAQKSNELKNEQKAPMEALRIPQQDSTRSPMRNPPLGVSIVIPNWNHECLLPRSIHSALKGLKQLKVLGTTGEIIVIDDGSRDGSRTLLRQLEALYCKEGLKTVFLPKNGDVIEARNHGLLLSQFRHVLFLDADNEIIPENLPAFYKAAIDTRAAMIYGNLLVDRGDGETSMISNMSFQDRLLNQNYIDTLALFDRMQLLDCESYYDDKSLPSREDWELVLHLAACGRRLVFVPMLFGRYYWLEQSRLGREDMESTLLPKMQKHIKRVFDQTGTWSSRALETRHLRYHPEIGYL